MSSVAITSWLVAISAVLALVIPVMVRRRATRHREQAKIDAATAAREAAKEKAAEIDRKTDRDNFASVNAAIQRREAELDRQLIESTREHNQEIRALKADHSREMAEIRDRVKELEKQVVFLQGLLRNPGSTP